MLEDKILDTNKAPTYNNFQRLNGLDYGFNLFGLIVALLVGFAALFEPYLLVLLALWNFFLGVYQLISAIVGSMRGNKDKQTYLFFAILYLIVLWAGYLFIGDSFGGDMEMVVLVIAVLLLPLIGAAYYTYLCFIAKTKNL